MSDIADLSDPLVVSASRRVGASAHAIFAVLADPGRHREFDGSTMVRGSDGPTITAVGDVFVTRMNNREYGDYEMRNHVVEFEVDRAIAWAPKRHDVVDDEDWNHRWGWRLRPDGDGTEVVAFFDGTRLPESGRRILRGGEVWRPVLVRSLERLSEVVEGE